LPVTSFKLCFPLETSNSKLHISVICEDLDVLVDTRTSAKPPLTKCVFKRKFKNIYVLERLKTKQKEVVFSVLEKRSVIKKIENAVVEVACNISALVRFCI
jgi:hypothetical protein